MKKLSKVAVLLASVMLVAPLASYAQTGQPTAEQFKYASGADQWRSAAGDPWRNGSGAECWRDSGWTPATAHPFCDGAAQPPAPKAAAAAPAAPPAAAPAPAPTAQAPAAKPAAQKVTYAADTFFDFDKSTLKPEGKAKLDDLVDKMKGINLEVIIAVGHTDNIGTMAYNQKLSERRANTVKAYLVSKGIEKNRIYTEGKSFKQPIASNKTAEGRAKNRRTEIEVVGTRAGN